MTTTTTLADRARHAKRIADTLAAERLRDGRVGLCVEALDRFLNSLARVGLSVEPDWISVSVIDDKGGYHYTLRLATVIDGITLVSTGLQAAGDTIRAERACPHCNTAVQSAPLNRPCINSYEHHTVAEHEFLLRLATWLESDPTCEKCQGCAQREAQFVPMDRSAWAHAPYGAENPQRTPDGTLLVDGHEIYE